MWKLKIAEGNGPWLTTVNNHIGRQHWEFDPQAGTPQERAQVEKVRQQFKDNRFVNKQSSDLLMRMQLRKENASGPIPLAVKLKETEKVTEETVMTTLRRSISFFSTIQAHDGHWPAESAGPMFFLPPLVIALYITGATNIVLSSEHKREILRYIYNHQNEDGGWGLHIESPSTMFGSTLNYVALRLLGEGPDDGEDKAMARARNWILDNGGAVKIPSWGKYYLTILGAHDWLGCNPVPPELWLLPKCSPIYPGKILCYCRSFYLPLSYLYGKRFVGQVTSLVTSLRQEIYIEPYHEIHWDKARTSCAKEDLYYPHPLLQDMLWEFLHKVTEPILTRWPFSKLRERALKVAIELVHYEDENSRYFSTGNVAKVLSMLACWVEDQNAEAFKFHIARIPDHFWIAEDGLKLQCFGSQSWDASLAIQAILSSNLIEEYSHMLKKGHDFIKASQVLDNPSGDFNKMYRHISKGGWTFSIPDHSWIVSDCTAEGLKVVLLLSQISPNLVGKNLEPERLYDAVNVILYRQSNDGGFPAWEPVTASRWLEKLNPIEFFEDTIIERPYVECTSSVIQALVLFKKLHPQHRRSEIESCISKAICYIEEAQNPDGSWYGCWGICFTYATWLAIEGLVACGRKCYNSPIIHKACEFLLSKQLPCGGWGESYLSCTNKVYTNLEGDRSNLVQTSYALLSLMAAGQDEIDPEPIHRGIRLLINSQMYDGDFPQQEIAGVFMKNCLLNYGVYRNIIPIWALGRYQQLFFAKLEKGCTKGLGE